MQANLKRPSWRRALPPLLLWIALALVAPAKDVVLETEANVMVELTFTASEHYADPFNELTLDVIFVDLQGREFRVPAFWAGTNLWKARYASPVAGTHRFHSESSNPRDQGLHNIIGSVQVKPYTGENPLYAHGPVHMPANKRCHAHAD